MAAAWRLTARDPAVCERKHRFTSEATARRSARRTTSRTGDQCHAYPCANCGGWHVGGLMLAELRKQKKKPRIDPTVDSELELWELNVDMCRVKD